MKKIKEVANKARIPFISTIIFIIIYIGLVLICFNDLFMISNISLLLVSLILFSVPLLVNIMILKVAAKDKAKNKTFTKISILLGPIFMIYLLIVIFIVGVIESMNAVTNYKTYKILYNKNDAYINQFPKNVPRNAKNVKFYYYPGALQSDSLMELYYKVDDKTLKEYKSKYGKSAIWIGDSYSKNDFLDKYDISYNLNLESVRISKDYTIYYLCTKCDNSGYCNHGGYSFAAINEDTNECIFKYQYW